ncbi:hypothetical protein AVEN_202810-1 [Araneus ventricosus]|uniref:Uncharacterized protein n=1 Tax=Araneus ventricosus TaxID=182803 RepID=A0A4Y2DLG3_ARAVE|nr:hypothetical protein AVEN_202810-1 [Araneus ventricosus]
MLGFGGETRTWRLRLEFGVLFEFRSRFSRSANIGSQVSARDSVLVRASRPRETGSQTIGWVALRELEMHPRILRNCSRIVSVQYLTANYLPWYFT